MEVELLNPIEGVEFYVNTNKTILYIYDKKKNKIERIFSDKWTAKSLPCIVSKREEEWEEDLNFREIINADRSFIKVVDVVSSTVKKPAFSTETDTYGITSNYLNEFLGSVDFIEAIKQNRFEGDNKSALELLKIHCKSYYILFKNLFYNENDDVLINFLNWLNVISYSDKHQDVLWLFFGTDSINEGQGAGKGVLTQILKEMLSGLTTDVSMTTYQNNFNADLMNKKICVFDEVEFKNLNWSRVKNITGNPVIRVENKGKDPINTTNVSSWLMFTNEHDLQGKIKFDDRRAFLVRPNPKNGSLKDLISKSDYKCVGKFIDTLNDEMADFIHIIGLMDGNVLTPQQLQTAAHKAYHDGLTSVEAIDIQDFQGMLLNGKMVDKIVGILSTDEMLIGDDSDKKIKTLLKERTLNYKAFFHIFNLLQDNGFISKSLKPMFAWERVKEHSQKGGFSLDIIDMKKTKEWERFKDKSVLTALAKSSSANEKRKYRKLKQLLRELYGVRLVGVLTEKHPPNNKKTPPQ